MDQQIITFESLYLNMAPDGAENPPDRYQRGLSWYAAHEAQNRG